jgi:diamine N-acetyltransferase
MVGFMQIIPEEDDPKCLYLWRFMIDQNHQKKGYGKAAMLQLIDMAKARNKYETLKLSVEPENAVAIHLYESFGFKANGVIDDGEAEMVLPLTTTNSL